MNEQPKHADDIPWNQKPPIAPCPNQGTDTIQSSPQPAARGFLQVAGWAPMTTASFIAVDSALFAGNLAAMGLLLPFCIVSGVGVGWASYHWQIRAGDDHILALTKAVVIGLLIAIPSPTSLGVAGTAGIAGWIARI